MMTMVRNDKEVEGNEEAYDEIMTILTMAMSLR